MSDPTNESRQQENQQARRRGDVATPEKHRLIDKGLLMPVACYGCNQPHITQ